MANSKGRTTRDVNAAERAAMAVRLRAQKLGYDEIARRCGYASRGACHDAVQRELQRVVVENVEELRREEVAMLDRLQEECWKRLEDDEFSKAKLFAVDRLLMISERRSKLMGLDKRPEELIANQNYIKKIVIVGGQDEHSND